MVAILVPVAAAAAAAGRHPRWRASVLPALGSALGASVGLMICAASKSLNFGGLVLGFGLAYVGALLGHKALRRWARRSFGSQEVATRWARAERGARTGELAAALAHEIKNPLTPIRGYARLLRGELEAVAASERSTFEKGLSIIDAEAERIEIRVRRALERARDTSPGPVSLTRLLGEVVAILEVDPGVTRVELHLPSDLPPVRAIEDALQGALVNLFENAAEAMRGRPGPICVRGTLDGGYVRLSILDRGPGLGAVPVEAAMRTFFTTKTQGSGLGLAVARSAVAALGGELVLRNRSDGLGAEVELTLPVWNPPGVEGGTYSSLRSR